jgi:molecular chaperone HtpG
MAEKEPEAYATFWREFSPFLKEGIATDYEHREELLKLLRFHTTHDPDQLESLAAYKERMVEGQTEIYYVLAADLAAAQRSPHLDPFAARNIEVLLLVDVMDSFMLSNLREYDGLKLRNIDEPDLELPGEVEAAEDQVNDEDFARLQERIKAVLGDRIEEVRESKVLRGSPTRLVSIDDMPGREMQRIQQLLGQETLPIKRALELNRSHPMIAQLAQRTAANTDDPVTAAIVEQMYDNALLLEGLHTNPTSMVTRIQQLMEAAARAE